MPATRHPPARALIGLALLLGLPEVGADVDPDCLAIERSFAENRIADLAALEPAHPRWRALQAFRLAAAYIPADDKAAARAALRQGLTVVHDALAADPEDAELLLLGAMLDGQYLLIARWRFLHNGLRALRRLGRAERLSPANPRAALMRGTAKVLLPGVLGGDPAEGVEILEGAVRETALCDDGEWAQVDILNWLGRAHTKLGNADAALAAYQRALVRSPDNHWVLLALSGAGYEWRLPDDG